MIVTLIEMSFSDFVHLHHAQRRIVRALVGHKVSFQGLTLDVSLGAGTYVLGFAVVLHYVASYLVMADLKSRADQKSGAGKGIKEPIRNDKLVFRSSLSSQAQDVDSKMRRWAKPLREV